MRSHPSERLELFTCNPLIRRRLDDGVPLKTLVLQASLAH